MLPTTFGNQKAKNLNWRTYIFAIGKLTPKLQVSAGKHEKQRLFSLEVLRRQNQKHRNFRKKRYNGYQNLYRSGSGY